MNQQHLLDYMEEDTLKNKPSRLKRVSEQAPRIAELHAVLTSPRGDFFRTRMLQEAHVRLDHRDLERLRDEGKLTEYQRHIHKLQQFKLLQVEQDEDGSHYHRTSLGEQAINGLRDLERRLGQQATARIYDAALGVNSIRLFLRLYQTDREASFPGGEIVFKPSEIGKICLFLPRTIEGYAAVDKLNEAGILTYRDDNFMVFSAAKARGIYQYLLALLDLIE